MIFNNVLKRLIETKQFMAKDRILPVKYCIPTHVGENIYDLIKTKRYKSCLEIGSLFGFSSLFIAQALDEINGKLTIVDAKIEPINWDGEMVELGDATVNHIREAGYDKHVEFLWGRSQDVLPKLCKEKRKYQFIFIDGDHRFASVLLDLILADSMLTVGGAIALDDIGWAMAEKENLQGSANKALAYMFSTNRYRIDVVNGNFCFAYKKKNIGD